MATATKKASVSSPLAGKSPRRPSRSVPLRPDLDLVETVFRFLASLKLAVFSFSALAASLAFATCWLESGYGTATAQDFVYKAPGSPSCWLFWRSTSSVQP